MALTANMGFATRLADVVNIIFGNTYRHLFQRTESYLALFVTFIFKKTVNFSYGRTIISPSPAASPERWWQFYRDTLQLTDKNQK